MSSARPNTTVQHVAPDRRIRGRAAISRPRLLRFETFECLRRCNLRPDRPREDRVPTAYLSQSDREERPVLQTPVKLPLAQKPHDYERPGCAREVPSQRAER